MQRNLRKYLQLRTWPWYKLWQKVKPLLNVTRIEDEIAVSMHCPARYASTQRRQMSFPEPTQLRADSLKLLGTQLWTCPCCSEASTLWSVSSSPLRPSGPHSLRLFHSRLHSEEENTPPSPSPHLLRYLSISPYARYPVRVVPLAEQD